ncbi:MAG: glycosyltransferase family 2 protein [Rhodanobacteraceae bacterium]
MTVLNAMLHRLLPQVGALVLVDNASDDPVIGENCLRDRRITFMPQAINLGLAAAFNRGIAWARERGFKYVLLLDQDSLPAESMVIELWRALTTLAPRARIAAVGPRFRDENERRDAPFVRIRFPFNRKLHCGDDCPERVRCDFLISSGTLIPLVALETIGGMDESLFIDNVDMDWCFRARAKGFLLYGVCTARMEHRLGDARRRLPGAPRGVIVHAPRRLFFIMRNRLLLYRRASTPAVWVAQDVPRVLVKLLLFSVLIGPRWRNLRAMLAGLRAGLQGEARIPENMSLQ